MLKYIKWELKNYFSKKYIWFIIIACVYLLTSILDFSRTNFISGFIIAIFGLILSISFLGSFFLGTKKVVDTFRQKTFLLESMIPLPVKKILLSKYLLGIIINLLFSIIGILGFAVIIIKGVGFNGMLKVFEELFKNIDFLHFMRLSILYILSTMTFMSFVVLGYILTKVINPNGKGNRIIVAIIWIFFFYTYNWFISNVIGYSNNTDIYVDMLNTAILVGTFFLTSWLIENKLEIYN